MKMLMPLLTPASGTIHFQLPEGAVLVSGDLIARLELDDCMAVTAAQPYPGGFPELGPPLVHSQGVDYRFKEAYSAAKMILEGARCACTACRSTLNEGGTLCGCILQGHWQKLSSI
jgi:acetyl-CoA carboxylase/biotin carboxylase 1